ncbi:MAG TPA: UDP-N-acetylglucosamine--N-acetylmuramyl-(pentapeptide) pyrophosphoryl-undecaprenol N-acetylglucosamine transferase [Verrucomicrobiales bacterium]|nr:UDP-N-acetylglucosamine--N-acetylmuramyl-(pentapeptide) pyrophosphoryl-undecaprenol N-acetylglucosamine transferase [Verrucomicrobiales bacterium]
MNPSSLNRSPRVAIACGGSGGHLFPGIAVGEVLVQKGCRVILYVSSKEIDQQGLKDAGGMDVEILPAIGLTRRSIGRFASRSFESFRLSIQSLRKWDPDVILGMGGFTCAPPVLAGKILGKTTLIHEANSIPGKAVRFLAPWVDEVMVGFANASGRIASNALSRTGMPVRSQFSPASQDSCRAVLGLRPSDPLVLVMGGSQGAHSINALFLGILPELYRNNPALQCLHLTGFEDFERVRAVYRKMDLHAVVRPFLTEMEYALGAADFAISRSGASSMAEIAAMKLPSILIPYPHAAQNHQYHNARVFAEKGAACLFDSGCQGPSDLSNLISRFLENPSTLERMRNCLMNEDDIPASENVAGIVMSHLRRFGSQRRGDPGHGMRREFSRSKFFTDGVYTKLSTVS